MYFNTEFIKSKNLTVFDVTVLQLIRQNKTEDMSETIESVSEQVSLSSYEDLGYITRVKKKRKNDSDFSVLRTTKKGNALLENCELYKVLPEDETVFEWLKTAYTRESKEIGSERKCKELIAWFRTESQIAKNALVVLCKEFINDETRMQYSQVLQYIFWKSENHFQRKPSLGDSKLWQYYEKRRKFFDAKFIEIK